MFRITLGMSLALLLAASTSSAQIIAGASVGAGSFGGEFRPPVPAFPLPVHRNTFAAPMHRFGHPAFRPLYPYASPYYFSGFGGGFITSGYYSPYFGIQGPGTYIDDYIPPPAPPSPPAAAPRIVQLSGELPATLTLEFPAPATVWLNGNEVPGKPASVRAVTSPAIRPGERYTFRIRARWEANGKTFEYRREAALGPGDRSKLLVVSGEAVTDPK